VDGARRDLLETVTHGPRGDIVSVYTTFPWPALCEEVAKLRLELREGVVLEGDFRGLATALATTQRKGRNRWRKSVTPPGTRQRCTWRCPSSWWLGRPHEVGERTPDAICGSEPARQEQGPERPSWRAPARRARAVRRDSS
jgi:hypothetical protein